MIVVGVGKESDRKMMVELVVAEHGGCEVDRFVVVAEQSSAGDGDGGYYCWGMKRSVDVVAALLDDNYYCCYVLKIVGSSLMNFVH